MNWLERTATRLLNVPRAAAVFDAALRVAVMPRHKSVIWGDRLLTLDKIAAFRDEPGFAAAMAATSKETGQTQYADTDSIVWRMNTLIWAARTGLALKGDFVECGVYKGDMSWVVTEMVDLAAAGRTFYLYDTFDGFAPAYSSAADFPNPGFFALADRIYRAPGLFEYVRDRFAAKPHVKVIKGVVPDILKEVSPSSIAFLHIDMKSPGPETAAMEMLYDRVSPGAAIIYDDYGWLMHRKQKDAADAFMASRGQTILELPTGQGLCIKR